MALINELDQAFLVAMKEKQEPERSVLRMLRAVIKNKEIELKKDLDEKEVIGLIKSEVKKRKESIETYSQADRQDLADQEAAELKVLENYLPAQMTEENIRVKVEEVLSAASEEEKENFGVIMKKTMFATKGAADGGLVSRIVKEVLQK